MYEAETEKKETNHLSVVAKKETNGLRLERKKGTNGLSVRAFLETNNASFQRSAISIQHLALSKLHRPMTTYPVIKVQGTGSSISRDGLLCPHPFDAGKGEFDL